MGHSASDWQFEWLTTWDQVWARDFVAQWKLWMIQSPDAHVFFEPSVVRAWYETYRDLREIEPRFLIARRGSEQTVFYPLVFDHCGWKDAWLRVIRSVGYNEFDYHDPICNCECSKDVWSSFWIGLDDELEKRGRDLDLLSISRVRERCTGGVEAFEEVEKAPFINLFQFKSIDDLLAGRSKNLRCDIRRKQRRLTKEGEFRLQVFDKGETGPATEMLAGFLKAHQARWPLSYQARGFFERLIAGVLPDGFLHVSVLKVEDKVLSWHVGFTHKRRFYWYVPAYDGSMSRFSPGKIHLAELISECLQQGIKVFDFLKGEEPYKMEWTSDKTLLFQRQKLVPRMGPKVRLGARALLHRTARMLKG